MRPILRIAPALVVASVVAWTTTAAAPAAISPQLVVSAPELDLTGFSLAMNPSGTRSAVVQTGRRGARTQLLTRLGRGRSFGASQRLDDVRMRPGNGGFVLIKQPRASVSPDGSAVAAWLVTTVARRDGQPRYRLRFAIAPDGERFGRAHTLLSSARSQVELTGLLAGRRGLVVISWKRGQRVFVAVRRGARGFGAHQPIASDSDYGAPPTLALSPGGSVVIGWSPVAQPAAQAAILRAGALRFGPAQTVSAPGEPAYLARAVAGPGGAGVAWSLSGPFGLPARGTLRFARLGAGAGFAPPVTLADVHADGGPQVALPKLGVFTAWRHYTSVTEPGDNDMFSASRVAAAASWVGGAAPRRLSEPPALAHRPAVAALADRALIAWQQEPGSDVASPVHLAVAGADGWQPTQTIAADPSALGSGLKVTRMYDDERYSELDPALVAGSASALLAWTTREATSAESSHGQLRVVTYTP